jgi:glycosyltransferase involved in cell wall biosynthesis
MPRASTGPRPRICLLTETYYPVVGGGEKQAQMLAEDLVASGYQTMVVTRRSSGLLNARASVGGVEVYRIPPVGSPRLARWIMVLSSCRTLARHRHRYDVILVSGFKSLGVSAVAVASVFGKACILKADSNGEMSGAFFGPGLRRWRMTPRSPLVRLFLAARNRVLRGADGFVAITTGIADELRASGIAAGLIHHVTNGVDTRRFQPVDQQAKAALRRRLPVPDRRLLVAYTGRLVTYKGLPLLLRVAERFEQEHTDVGFVLIGSGGLDMHNCEAELRDFVAAHGLGRSVCFAGEVENVQEFLQASDVFVLPTEDDAFPLALVEAMACGLPVVASRVGGIPDIVTHDSDGLLTRAGDAEGLYNALCSVLTDSSRAARLGAAAADSVRRRFSRETILDKYACLFEHAWSRP